MKVEEEFEKYFEGALSGEELITFEKLLQEDTARMTYFELYRKARDFVDQQNGPLQKIGLLNEDPKMAKQGMPLGEAAKEAEKFLGRSGYNEQERKFLEDLNAAKHAVSGRQKVMRVLSWAAGFLLLISLVAVFVLHRKAASSDTLFASYYAPYTGFMKVRGATPASEGELEKAMILYNNKEYKDAAALLEGSLRQPGHAAVEGLYLAICYMEMQEFYKAIALLQPIASGSDALVTDQANWYLGLVFLKTGKRAAAKQCFTNLVQDSSSYAGRAAEILRKLN